MRQLQVKLGADWHVGCTTSQNCWRKLIYWVYSSYFEDYRKVKILIDNFTFFQSGNRWTNKILFKVKEIYNSKTRRKFHPCILHRAFYFVAVEAVQHYFRFLPLRWWQWVFLFHRRSWYHRARGQSLWAPRARLRRASRAFRIHTAQCTFGQWLQIQQFQRDGR